MRINLDYLRALTGAKRIEPASAPTDEQIVSALLTHQYQRRLKALSVAQAIAWNDLPPCEQRNYLYQAERAYAKEMAS